MEGLDNETADRILFEQNSRIIKQHNRYKAQAQWYAAAKFYHHKSDPLKFRGWRDI